MEIYRVKPIFAKEYTDEFELHAEAPGSKSITNRALMLAALADGETTLDGILLSEDSRHFINCLMSLGFDMYVNESSHVVRISGCGGHIPKNHVEIDVGSAGTAARFLTAMLGCSQGSWHIISSKQMKKRPMGALIRALEDLGCEFEFDEEENCFPFTIHGHGIQAREVSVDISQSSQFLSALLMAGVLSDHDFTVRVKGSHGLSYVRITTHLMREFGIDVHETGSASSPAFCIAASSRPLGGICHIEPDVSAAAYFYAMGAISGGRVLVKGVHKDSCQGDIAFLNLLEQMGCTLSEESEGIALKGPALGRLNAVDADMSGFSDQALTLAAIAPWADGPVTIRGISHIRLQECDRINAITENLGRMEIHCKCSEDDVITIWPGRPHSALIETWDDHRVAMAFAVTGMRAPGIVIRDPRCCRKTFENYFDVLDKICQTKGLEVVQERFRF